MRHWYGEGADAVRDHRVGGRRATADRYEAATPAEAIEKAKGDYAINSATNDAWAFAREGAYRLVDSEEARDVITVDFWSKGMPYVASLMQRFTRAGAAGRFHLDVVPNVVDNGAPLDADERDVFLNMVLRHQRLLCNLARSYATQSDRESAD